MAKFSEFERLYYPAIELAERRGDALQRVWVVIETQVHDRGVANALRMAILGPDLIPDIDVFEVDEEEVEEEEEPA